MRYQIPKQNSNPTKFEIKSLYGLDAEEARAMKERMKWELTDAEYFLFLFKPIDRKIVKRFIPPPLELIPKVPLMNIFIQQLTLNGGKGNDSLNYGYYESILGALVSYKGKAGFYAISIQIESDIGAMVGREMFGTAKKVGQFEHERNGDNFSWKVMRRGITLIEASGQIMEEESDPSNIVKLMENPNYHLHQNMGTFEGSPYAYPPRLMKMNTGIKKIHKMRACDNVKMVYHESPFDPICLMQPKEIYAVTYMNADTFIDTISPLEDLDPEEMLPFLFAKLDPF